ncbi:MAG: hypothetical protein PHO37_06680 [Kiritimatiellae bacterium]|nr:hypothetical protein [Kiritimatiellia bacterium]
METIIFDGMAFGVAIRHIGFSLTYAIAIGISAGFGTAVPAEMTTGCKD